MGRRANEYMFYVYLLKGLRGHLYVGSTRNPEKRRQRHVDGDGAEFTKRNKVDTVVYTEAFPTLTEARRREEQIKGWTREKKENLIKYGKPFKPSQ